jgi:serine/threonine protein kinase
MWACGIIMSILLTGHHPLFNPDEDNERSFIQKLKNPQWNFDDSFYSVLAKDLFLKLCNPTPLERYTSDKALKHPWITRDFKSSIPLTQSE